MSYQALYAAVTTSILAENWSFQTKQGSVSHRCGCSAWVHSMGASWEGSSTPDQALLCRGVCFCLSDIKGIEDRRLYGKEYII